MSERLNIAMIFGNVRSLWSSIVRYVEGCISENNDTLIENNSIEIVMKGISGMKESFLIDDFIGTTYTQLSSWFVVAPNETVGNFKATVMIHDKVNNDIFSLQSTLTFDYTDPLNEVDDDNGIILAPPVALELGIDANKQLYATITGMHVTNNERIHFCFERCANNPQTLTLDHLEGEGTIHEPTIESEATVTLDHLEGEGTVHEVTAEALGWELLAEFTTNSPNTTTFDPSISASSGEYKWDVGGVEVLGTSVSMTLDGTHQTVKLYGKGNCEIISFSTQENNINGDLTFTNSAFEYLRLVSIIQEPHVTSINFPATTENTLLGLIIMQTSISSLDISMFDKYLENPELIEGTPLNGTIINILYNFVLDELLFPDSTTGKIEYLSIVGTDPNQPPILENEALNLSGLNSFTDSAIIEIAGLSILSLTFASSVSGSFYAFNISGLYTITYLDVSMFTNFNNAEIYQLNLNYSLSGIQLPNLISGNIINIEMTSNHSETYPNNQFPFVDVSAFNFDVINIYISISRNNYGAAENNHILVEIDNNSSGGISGRVVKIDSNIDSYSGGYDGLAAKASLEAKGFTVTTF